MREEKHSEPGDGQTASIAMKTVTLGPEFEPALRQRLRAVLTSMGAESLEESWWAVGGSQEISHAEVSVDGATLIIEAETYIGLTITGPASLVGDIADRVRTAP